MVMVMIMAERVITSCVHYDLTLMNGLLATLTLSFLRVVIETSVGSDN